MPRFPLALATALLAFAAQDRIADARILEVGAGKPFQQPSAAIEAAHDGDTIRIQPGEYFDCATIAANKLTVEGVGDPATVLMTDKTCGGKALLITSGNDATIRNLTLTRARVPDGNGAGIRMESRNLTIDGVRFVNNQEGILAGIGKGTVTVTNSVFDGNGACEHACAHGIYLNDVDLLHVERTSFLHTRKAHSIKSGAVRTEVIDSTFDDGPDGTASYAIEVPHGGSLLVRGTTITKGPRAENHTAIAIGTDSILQMTREITVENSTFKNQGRSKAIFVDNRTATEAMLRDDTLVGAVTPLKGDGKVSGGPSSGG